MRWEPTQLEEVACDLCGRRDAAPLTIRPDGLRVVACPGCGLAFVSPRPRAELIRRLYAREYFGGPGSGSADVGYANYLEAGARSLADRIDRAKLDIAFGRGRWGGRRILEVGCATGEVTAALCAAGAEVLGIDISDEIIGVARERHPGVRFEACEVSGLPRDVRFDTVVAFEVIEHAPSPRRFLEEIHARLIPGAIVVLSTPNLDCARRVGVDRWLGFNASYEHLHFFTPRTLAAYAEQTGFTQDRWYTGVWRGRVLRERERPPVLDRINAVLRWYGAPEWVAPSYRGFRRGGHAHALLTILRCR